MFFDSDLKKEIVEKDALIQKLRTELNNLKKRYKEDTHSLKESYFKEKQELETLTKEHKGLVQKVESISNVDMVSGSHNMRYFYDVVENLISLCKRDKTKLSIILFEVSTPKNIAEQTSLDAKVLQDVVHKLSANIRESDLFVRLEHAKFIVALPKTSHEQAQMIAKKLQKLASKVYIDNEHSVVLNTVAIEYDDQNNINEIIKKAESRLKSL